VGHGWVSGRILEIGVTRRDPAANHGATISRTDPDAENMRTHDPASLICQHAGLIHRIAYAWCRDASGREEIMQEIALQLWRSRERFDARRDVKETTWVYRVALNVAISFHRRERRHRQRRAPLEDRAITIAETDAAQRNEEIESLLACVDELPALDKALVLLHLDGNDHAAIGEVLGISTTNVSTKLSRIKERLRVALERRAATTRTEKPHAAR
jgi:RNA polymerase sigma-70 factor (ECF subfamily)